MAEFSVKTLVEGIASNLKQTSASKKDEVAVMQAMLNDRSYEAGVYGLGEDGTYGKIGSYNPSDDARKLIGSTISATTKIGKDEAAALAEAHVFSKQEAESFVGITKEYINVYGTTGRKLPLGGRVDSNVALAGSFVDTKETRYPKKVGIDAQGNAIYQNESKTVPAHRVIRAMAPCPEWCK